MPDSSEGAEAEGRSRLGTRGIDRRGFLKAGALGLTGLALGLRNLGCGEGPPPAPGPGAPAAAAAPPVYGDWRDVYRERWAWDRIVRSTHFVNCWYQSSCAWNVYVKDGVVWREEQVAEYPQTNAEVPDPNPRGCQKGGCFSERMYDPTRIGHPLQRVGPRGSGRWKRVAWDEALDAIADVWLDTLRDHGSERVIWELGPLYTVGTQSAGHQRLSILLDSTNLDMNNEIGDGHPGAAETFGKIVFERSADDYFHSDLILIWGGNPLYTQIPNAHYLTEARYKGAKLVCIAPDFSASSIHADLYVPVKPGGDAALGLAIAQVLVEEGFVDEGFVAEQTDLPLLVRDDTRLYLRASDLHRGGSEEEFRFYDAKRGLTASSKRSLALEGAQPSLEGHFEAVLADGSHVGVRPVFELLKQRLAEYAPERAEAMCGTPAASDPPPRAHARAGARGQHGHHQQFRQVLPRQSDRAMSGAGLRARGPVRQEGQRLRRLPLPVRRRTRALRAQHVLGHRHAESRGHEDHRPDPRRQRPLEARGPYSRDARLRAESPDRRAGPDGLGLPLLVRARRAAREE